MTQFRRTSRGGRVLFASAAIVALSLVGHGSATTASEPTPQVSGIEPDMVLAGSTNGEPAISTGGRSSTTGEDSAKTPSNGQTGKGIAHDCGVDAPATTPSDVPAMPSKDVRPTAPSAWTEPSLGAGPEPGKGVDAGKGAKKTRPGGVVLPELREGAGGVEELLGSAIACAVPEPVAKPPVQQLPRVSQCVDPATDVPPVSGGGSSAQPDPGSIDGQREDQPMDSPTCTQSDPDSPVSNDGDPEPAVDLPAVADDSVAAQEPGDLGPAR
jgi:hypothetical protein